MKVRDLIKLLEAENSAATIRFHTGFRRKEQDLDTLSIYVGDNDKFLEIDIGKEELE